MGWKAVQSPDVEWAEIGDIKGPPGPEGPRGPAGDATYDDMQDLTLLFENGLI